VHIRYTLGAGLPDIWGELPIGALRVATFNPAASGCKMLAPVTDRT